MRISGITIPEKKRLEIGLTAIYGIGISRSRHVLNHLHINPHMRPASLSVEDENRIRKEIEQWEIEGELKRRIGTNIKHLKDLKCYRGIRHSKKLPVRGQRTKSNSRTVRGNVRKTMGSGKRKLEKK